MRTDWHILSATEELSTRNGSAILTVARNLALAARERGHGAWLMGGHHDNNDLGNIVELLETRPKIINPRINRNLDAAAKYFFGRSLETPRIKNSENNQPSHIYCHNQPWLIRSVRQHFPQAKLYLYVHNRILRGARASTIRSIIDSCDAVICVSDFIRQDLGKRAGMSAAEVNATMRVQINGVDSSPYLDGAYAEDEPQYDVVYVGRIIPEKGVHVLADALARAAKIRPISALVVGGHSFLPGAETKYVQSVQRALHNTGVNVTFTGPVPPDTIPGLINSAKLHVVPSVWDEPCALVLLEGLASRACLISTHTGGTPEIAAGTRLDLVPAGDSRQLELSILRYLEDTSMRRNHSLAQRTWARQQSWGKVYSQILADDER